MWRARATSVPSPQKVQEKLRKSGDKLKGITFETRLIKGLVIIDRLGRKGDGVRRILFGSRQNLLDPPCGSVILLRFPPPFPPS